MIGASRQMLDLEFIAELLSVDRDDVGFVKLLHDLDLSDQLCRLYWDNFTTTFSQLFCI